MQPLRPRSSTKSTDVDQHAADKDNGTPPVGKDEKDDLVNCLGKICPSSSSPGSHLFVVTKLVLAVKNSCTIGVSRACYGRPLPNLS